MPYSLTHINVFVASPGDVLEERELIASVVQELNPIFRSTMGVCLDLVRWETHAYPSVGVDAQDVINNQIADDYDIFIGLMWKRFGTRTGRAGSGTEEEFDRAYNLHKATNGKTKVMIYFSDRNFSMNDMDIEQIIKVKEFKKKTMELGVLHWGYSDVDNFQQLLRLHLSKQVKDVIDDYNKSKGNDSIGVPNSPSTNSVIKHDIDNEGESEDLGFFDLLEIFHEKMSEVAKLMADLREDMNDLGVSINLRTEKLTQLNNAKIYAPDDLKRVYSQIANDSISYASKSNTGISKFHDLYTEAISSLSEAITIQRPFISLSEKQSLIELIEEIVEAKRTNGFVVDQTKAFRYQVKSMPPVSKILNKAYKILIDSLSYNIKEFNGYSALLDQVEIVLREIVDSLEDDESSAEVLD